MQRRIAAILTLLFVGGITAVVVGVAGAIVSLNRGSTNASDTSVPPGWNKHASSEGLTLSVDLESHRIHGHVSPELANLNDKVTVQYWPEGAFRILTKDEESKYKGYADPGTLVAYVGPDGSFETDFKGPPPAIRVNGELRLTEPGRHWYVLILDDKHATFALFEVTVPGPIPTVSQQPYFAANSFWFLDSKTGWLSGGSCRDQPRPTPDQYGNESSKPPICKPAFYGTTDSGHTWQLLYYGPLEAFQFVSPSVGIAYNNAGSCPKGPCRSQILRTTDGGRTWKQTYQPFLSLGNLTIVAGEPWLVGSDCDQSTATASRTSYLLRSVDGGATWIQTTLPVAGRPYLSMSRPTAHDAFATANYDHQGGPGVLLATHDGGATWTSSALPADLFEGRLVSFRTATDGWLLSGGQPGGPFQSKLFYRTRDGGATWIKLSGKEELGSVGYIEPLTFAGEQSIWMPVVHFGLRHSTDGGKTWTSLTADGKPVVQTEDQQAVIRFTDQQHGWTMTNYFTPPPSFQQQQALWATSDGGSTWQKLPLPTPEVP